MLRSVPRLQILRRASKYDVAPLFSSGASDGEYCSSPSPKTTMPEDGILPTRDRHGANTYDSFLKKRIQCAPQQKATRKRETRCALDTQQHSAEACSSVFVPLQTAPGIAAAGSTRSAANSAWTIAMIVKPWVIPSSINSRAVVKHTLYGASGLHENAAEAGRATETEKACDSDITT